MPRWSRRSAAGGRVLLWLDRIGDGAQRDRDRERGERERWIKYGVVRVGVVTSQQCPASSGRRADDWLVMVTRPERVTAGSDTSTRRRRAGHECGILRMRVSGAGRRADNKTSVSLLIAIGREPATVAHAALAGRGVWLTLLSAACSKNKPAAAAIFHYESRNNAYILR
jgi:hypothetical protein